MEEKVEVTVNDLIFLIGELYIKFKQKEFECNMLKAKIAQNIQSQQETPTEEEIDTNNW